MRSSFAELMSGWLKDPAGTKATWDGPVLVQRLTTAGSDKDDGGPTRAAFVMSRPDAGESRVHLVAKSNKPNAFPMGVTIGRTGGNDIELDDHSISRFHAWLQQDARTKVWALTDAESKNGTWVAGVELAPKQRVPLTDQTEIRLGNVFLTFLLPASLWALVLANPPAKP